jgi:hydroxymethylpyrimidine pyrophosphatase-like HAD family hydrolase
MQSWQMFPVLIVVAVFVYTFSMRGRMRAKAQELYGGAMTTLREELAGDANPIWARARLSIKPDFLVVVERDIYFHEGAQYEACAEWNNGCKSAHAELFERVRSDVPRLVDWVSKRFRAALYEDDFSPFCLIADNNEDADAIQVFLDEYCVTVPSLTLVRNDVYARFSHARYNKGTALAEIARQLGIARDHIFAAGDHLNDLPMLSGEFARCVVAPDNAVSAVKELVRSQNGYVSHQPWGHGVARGLEHFLGQPGSNTA